MLAIHLKCPAHPRWDPAKRGEGGIKGGCVWCRRIYQLYVEARALEMEMDRVTWRRRMERLALGTVESA